MSLNGLSFVSARPALQPCVLVLVVRGIQENASNEWNLGPYYTLNYWIRNLLHVQLVFFGLFSFVLKFLGIMESLVGNTTPHLSFLTLYGKSTSQSYNKYKIYKRSIYNKYKYIWNGLDFFLSKLLVKVKLHKNNLISLCIFPILGHFSNWYNYIKCIAGGVY